MKESVIFVKENADVITKWTDGKARLRGTFMVVRTNMGNVIAHEGDLIEKDEDGHFVVSAPKQVFVEKEPEPKPKKVVAKKKVVKKK